MAKGFLDGYKTYDTSKGFGNSKKWRESFQQRMNKEDAADILQQHSVTPYTVLGISPEVSFSEIKKAFHKLILEWHPDKNQHRIKEAEEMSKKIIAAYIFLSEEKLKKG